MRTLLFLLFGLSLAGSFAKAAPSLIGQKPPEWTATEWLNSKPLTLAELRGKVLVVRWWTGPGCPYCTRSAAVLNRLWEKDRQRGLVVIGMYHHKSEEPLTMEHVVQQTKRLGFAFPVAVDRDWKTLHRWWLDPQQGTAWTSVTFVIGRDGAIRHIHPGGAIVEGEADCTELEKAVETALAE